MPANYTVYVDDNFAYMDEKERYKLGEFDDCGSAIAACKNIVDRFLAGCDLNRTAEEIHRHYTSFGEDPWIKTDDPHCKFSAWTYAKPRSRELSVVT